MKIIESQNYTNWSNPDPGLPGGMNEGNIGGMKDDGLVKTEDFYIEGDNGNEYEVKVRYEDRSSKDDYFLIPDFEVLNTISIIDTVTGEDLSRRGLSDGEETRLKNNIEMSITG